MLYGSGFALHSSGLRVPLQDRGEDGGRTQRREGVQEEEIKMKHGERTKTGSKSALVVKRKQLRETERGGRKRVVIGRGTLTLQNGTLMGARPRLSGFSFFFPVWFH